MIDVFDVYFVIKEVRIWYTTIFNDKTIKGFLNRRGS